MALMAQLDELARYSEQAAGLTRPYLTPSHKQATLQVMRWMEEAGMKARTDAIGNVVGRYEGREASAPALLLGSHIDTVRNAGKYDGNLGVLAAIACVAELAGRGERLPFAIEVYAFGDEEGVRFPTTLSGSRAVAGRFDPAALDARDSAGVSLRQALTNFGCDVDAIRSIARKPADVLAYVELHIEQGPVLEAEGLALGVVTAIAGASRYAIEITGVAGHAGTVPMGLRRDALAGAAEMIAAVERRATATPDVVATVGRIEALPGAANVIPSMVRFTIDIRAPSDTARHSASAQIVSDIEAIAGRRSLSVQCQRVHDAGACTCDRGLIGSLGAAVARASLKPRHLPSGAGHDAMAMVELCPVGMLFMRCTDGISHNPLEAITVEDADLALRVLLDFLRHFKPICDGS
jgi:allantoate deiminase